MIEENKRLQTIKESYSDSSGDIELNDDDMDIATEDDCCVGCVEFYHHTRKKVD